MKDFKSLSEGYLFEIQERGKKSKVYKPYQMIGLQLSELLDDDSRKSLYIKLAKEHPAEKLLGLAKRIAENRDIRNKGAYFMSAFFNKDNVKDSHNRP